jgi:hypothetical protein
MIIIFNCAGDDNIGETKLRHALQNYCALSWTPFSQRRTHIDDWNREKFPLKMSESPCRRKCVLQLESELVVFTR